MRLSNCAVKRNSCFDHVYPDRKRHQSRYGFISNRGRSKQRCHLVGVAGGLDIKRHSPQPSLQPGLA